MSPLKIVQISDIHIVRPGHALHGLNPAERLRKCVQEVNRLHRDADLCVVTGDLTDIGERDAYVEFRRIISDLEIPVQLMIGNHDNRVNFTRVFPEIETDPNGFIQSARRLRDTHLLFLDTNEPGTHSGAYCVQRQKWLSAQLHGIGADEPVIIFLHHQPFEIGWPAMDEIGLIHGAEIQDIIRANKNIAAIIFGHVHRTVHGSWEGVSFSAVPSLNHQIWWGGEGMEDIKYTHEAPAYNVIMASGRNTVLYQHPLIISENGIELIDGE